MNRKTTVLRWPRLWGSLMLLCLPLMILCASSACAQDMQAIKERMLERKPTIDALKDQGVVGEGIDGYLHFRQQAGGGAADVVRAENEDRRTANAMIARKEGVPIEKVSRKAAQTIIAKARPGHWVQRQDGTWYRK